MKGAVGNDVEKSMLKKVEAKLNKSGARMTDKLDVEVSQVFAHFF